MPQSDEEVIVLAVDALVDLVSLLASFAALAGQYARHPSAVVPLEHRSER